MRSIRIACVLLAAVFMVAPLPARLTLAKGNPSKVMISGPGIKTPVVITDKVIQDALTLSVLEDFETRVIQAPIVGEAYEIVQYVDEPTGEEFAISRLLYFPGMAGQRSILFNVLDLGFDKPGTTAGNWYYPIAQGEAILTAFLAKHVLPVDSHAIVETKLGPTPQDCRDNTRLDNSEAVVGEAVELTAVTWVAGFSGPRATLNIATTRPEAHGWNAPVRWMSMEFVTVPITIFGRNIADNSQVWFQIEGEQPTTALVLGPKNVPVNSLHKGWLEYPATIYVPQEGCYLLDVHWGKIASQVKFAAGRTIKTDGT
jgi:hypothetical protein